ncbi:hypothetical protein [Aquimarina algiphila]|uniref:Leucine-rich repeat domain-containing protein n=1 Tax=Aquimarina algiphila TaxID=2047982 RepID=A0A554VGH2_9FLAO|nr:hypothetical protein [Aquimarina algiphila]TSE06482.1 hypothetical protein FOF46_19345 [Aquimarina algiphila]
MINKYGLLFVLMYALSINGQEYKKVYKEDCTLRKALETPKKVKLLRIHCLEKNELSEAVGNFTNLIAIKIQARNLVRLPDILEN